jgi:hypothetical protein
MVGARAPISESVNVGRVRLADVSDVNVVAKPLIFWLTKRRVKGKGVLRQQNVTDFSQRPQMPRGVVESLVALAVVATLEAAHLIHGSNKHAIQSALRVQSKYLPFTSQ